MININSNFRISLPTSVVIEDRIIILNHVDKIKDYSISYEPTHPYFLYDSIKSNIWCNEIDVSFFKNLFYLDLFYNPRHFFDDHADLVCLHYNDFEYFLNSYCNKNTIKNVWKKVGF